MSSALMPIYKGPCDLIALCKLAIVGVTYCQLDPFQTRFSQPLAKGQVTLDPVGIPGMTPIVGTFRARTRCRDPFRIG